jgi:hypothetical protein
MTQCLFSAGAFLLINFCLIFIPFGHYDEPEILSYENTSMCPKGADVRQRRDFLHPQGSSDNHREMAQTL